MIIEFKKFEKMAEILYCDVAWLYFLYYVYNGEMLIKNWINDSRMGVDCMESFSKFPCVSIGNEYITSTIECKKIIDDFFGVKTFGDIFKLQNELRKYDTKSYKISRIPYSLFVCYKNPNIDKSFDRISDLIVDHFNSQRALTNILDKISKTRHIDKWNYKTAFEMFDGNIPEKIVIYRGLKCDYNPNIKSEYSCWTTSLNEAERFSKYIFTGGKQFKPIYSTKQTILVSEVLFDDVAIFIGGEESEVIMKGDVHVDKIINN